MKRVVFLCILVVTSLTSVSASSTNVYTFDTYDFRLTTVLDEDNHRGYEVEKIGQNPFTTTLFSDTGNLTVLNVMEIRGEHVFYGNTLVNGPTNRHYNGFVVVLDVTGEIKQYIEFDYTQNEDVRAIYTMNDVMMILIRVAECDDNDTYEFLQYKVEIHDYSFSHIEDVDINQEQAAFVASDEMLLMDQDGDEIFEQGILQTGDVIDSSDPLSIPPNAVYTDDLYIPFMNEALINNEPYYNGVFLYFPGYYTIEYNNQTYEFIMEGTIEGVEDGGIYNRGVVPHVSGGQVYLNDDLYVTDTMITEPGDYHLVLRGIGGYEQELSFTITSSLEGLYDNQTYQDDVSFSFNGTGYLNNSFITSPYVVDEPGDYVLTIEGENNYQEIYEFRIEDVQETHTFTDFLKQYDLIILGVTVVSGLLILKKK